MKYYDLSGLKKWDIIGEYKFSLLARLIYFFSTLWDKTAQRKRNVKVAHLRLYIGNGETIHMQWSGLKRKKLPNYSKKRYIIDIARVKGKYDQALLEKVVSETLLKAPKYDFLRLPIILVRKVFRLGSVVDFKKKLMICSELISICFKAAGIVLVPGLYDCDVTPWDIMTSKSVTLIMSHGEDNEFYKKSMEK